MFTQISRSPKSPRRIAGYTHSLLGQVAETPEELEKLIKLSDTLSEQHGLSRQATGQLVFDAKSGGFLQSAEFLAANAAGEMGIGLGSQSSVAMKSPGLFPDQNLTPEQAINATLVAAQRSDANFGMVGGVVSNLAASTAPLGSSLEETVGAVSALSTKFGSPDQAGNRIATFASKAALDERLQGKGLTGAFRAFEDEFSDEEKKKFVGQNQQLAEAVNNLRQEFDLIVERTAEAAAAIGRTGTGGSPSRVMRTNILSDPLRRAKLTSAQSRERRLGAEMGTAETELLRQAGVDKYAADALGRGESMFSIAVGDKAANALTGAGLGGASPAAMDLFSGIGFGDMATALSNPTGMASSVAGFGRRRMFGEGEAGSDPDAAKKILEELQGLRGDMQESNEINRESADASKTTARNTKPKRRDTSRVIEAAGDSDSIIKSARGSG